MRPRISSAETPRTAAGGGSDTVFYWELADRLGTGLVMVDETGARIVHRVFTPFGGTHDVAGSAAWLPTHFAGHRQVEPDGFHGIYDMKARWMDATTGTFLSVDPLVPRIDDPQSLNAYASPRNARISFMPRRFSRSALRQL